MAIFRTLFALIALFLLAGGSAAEAPRYPDIYVMRHLEYRGTGSHARLSEIGANNARRLSTWFKTAPPKAIYTATEQVSLDTSAWLAIEIRVNPKLFDPNRLDALMAKLAGESGPVLVVASREHAAEIIARASGKPAPRISEDAFGEIWSISGRDRSVVKQSLYGTVGTNGGSTPDTRSKRRAPTDTSEDDEVAEH
jgi:hypothetical protein